LREWYHADLPHRQAKAEDRAARRLLAGSFPDHMFGRLAG